ncbi:hypothetical protein [Roseovarius azorensis]|nr:hypothetical protein [Roseovarius azorensis]
MLAKLRARFYRNSCNDAIRGEVWFEMDVPLTILIILGFIFIAPFVVLAGAVLMCGLALGLIFSFLVALAGIELSMAIFLTCMVAGVVLAALTGLGALLEGQETKDKEQ